MIDFFATLPHYVDHLAPLWCALPASERGRFYVAGAHLPDRAALHGVLAGEGMRGGLPPQTDRPVVIAGTVELAYLSAERPVCLVEHGYGQTYQLHPTQDEVPNYPGGPGRDRISLMLCPAERVCALNEPSYPGRSVAVGPMHLDQLIRNPLPEVRNRCWAFHWDCPLVPEAMSAWPWWRGELAGAQSECVHAHPRIEPRVRAWVQDQSVGWYIDYEDVFTAAVLLVDNSSLACEYAAVTGRPVVLLNAPWYRRGVEHGARFWDWHRDLGVTMLDNPADLDGFAVTTTASARLAAWAYEGLDDGKAAMRGARHLLEWADSPALRS